MYVVNKFINKKKDCQDKFINNQNRQNKMDIDITDLTSNEIIQILSNFPNGRLVIKNDRIFWDSASIEPLQNRPQEVVRSFDPRQPPKVRKENKVGDAFARMADTLGSMVC